MATDKKPESSPKDTEQPEPDKPVEAKDQAAPATPKDAQGTAPLPPAVIASPPNIFSNDGSFMTKFKLMQAEQEEKRKKEEAVEKKKQWEAAFKRRGKRKKAVGEEEASKKSKLEEDGRDDLDSTANAYLNEMRKMREKHGEGDTGSGVRPLVK
ncbi:hypothetical protein HK104_009096 [Borealophlyctis nickersoniae]|nr:hypothetical protein HK104_009096 [Borealophlyctis nickersoniae]